MMSTTNGATVQPPSMPSINGVEHTPIVAIDPGGTTGVALLNMRGEIRTNSFRTFQDFDKLIQPGHIIIVEQPFLTASVDPIVFEVAGAAYERAWFRDCTLIKQPAYIPNFVWTRHRLQGRVPGNQHQKDAFSHLVYYLINIQKWNLLDVLKALEIGTQKQKEKAAVSRHATTKKIP